VRCAVLAHLVRYIIIRLKLALMRSRSSVVNQVNDALNDDDDDDDGSDDDEGCDSDGEFLLVDAPLCVRRT